MREGPFPPDSRNASEVVGKRLNSLDAHGGGKAHLPQCHCFLRDNGADTRATDAFLELRWQQQRDVMEAGAIGNTQNPSAVLMARIRDASKGVKLPKYGGGR